MSDTLKMQRLIAAAGIAAMLTACSGGHSNLVPQAPNGSKPSASGNAKAKLVVKIPKAQNASSTRKRTYISPSTQSIGFNYRDTLTNSEHQEQFANVTPGSPGCTSDANGTTCTLTFGASAGEVFYTVKAYDGQNGSGNALGYADATATIVANQDNPFNITLDGVVSKIDMSLENASIPAGAPVDDPIAVSLYDADNNLIVNSPEYAFSLGGAQSTATLKSPDMTEFAITQNGQPLGLNQGDPTLYDVNMPYTGLVLHYNGGLRKDASLSFNTAGVTANATLSVTAPTSTASLVYIPWYSIGQFGGGDFAGVTGLPGGASGTVDGLETWADGTDNNGCSGSSRVESYSELTTDANGNVAFLATPPCSGDLPAIVAHTPGVEAPAWQLTLLPNVVSFGFDGTNAPYLFINEGTQQSPAGTVDNVGQIAVLQPGSNGAYLQAMVARTIDYVNAPEALFVAADGTIYAAHVGNASTDLEVVDVFAPGTSGSVDTTGAPERYIGGSNTGLATPVQMALDSQGYLYVANHGNGSNGTVTVYAPNANGNVAPVRTITGAGVSNVGGIAIDKFDNLYVFSGSISVFAPGADGNATPVRTFDTRSSGAYGTMALIN